MGGGGILASGGMAPMGSNSGQVIATPSEEFSMKATRPFRPKFVASTARLSTCIVEKYRWPWGMGGLNLFAG